MRNLPFIVIMFMALTACKPNEHFEDNEIKGLLTTDKSAMGNEYLEVKDIESDMTRFIHPGKKIISIDQGLTKVTIKIFDGRRVQLASITAPKKSLQITDHQLVVPGTVIGQNWDLVATRVPVPLQTEYLATRHSDTCANNTGLQGKVWRVYDYRNDYRVRFMVPGVNKVWAELTATGERLTETTKTKISNCQRRITIHNAKAELYE